MTPQERAHETFSRYVDRIMRGAFVEDPVERLEHYVAVRTDVCQSWAGMNAEVKATYPEKEKRRAIFGFAAVLGVTLIGAAFGAAMASSVVPAYLTFVGAGAVYVTALPDWKMRRFKSMSRGLNTSLKGLDMLATQRIQETVEKYTDAVAHRVDLFSKHPDIGAMFEMAAVKKIDARRSQAEPGIEPKL